MTLHPPPSRSNLLACQSQFRSAPVIGREATLAGQEHLLEHKNSLPINGGDVGGGE